jgi:hypothetical protein
MALPASAADEVRTACCALAETAEVENPEIAAAGLGLAEAAAGDLQNARFNLRIHLSLQTLMSRIQTAAESSQAGRIWAAAQNLAELLLVIGKFLDDAPEPTWAEEFPPALCGVEAVRREFSNLVSVLGWPMPPDQYGLDEIAQALHSAGQLIDPAPEAPLCQYLGGARQDLVRETHIAWIESHDWDDESPSPAQVYGWYWNETTGGAALDGAKVAEAAATASAVAKWMGLDEVVDYLRDPDQVTYYGMMNVLPATPIRWSLENEEAAGRHLHYGLARWYHRQLEASLVPIDVITGVLRTRRPYNYHHMLAHALVQTICCQRVLPPGIVADAIVEKLAAFCDLMLDGYRLRCQYLPRLKTTGGWVEYLNALVALHFPDGQHGASCCLSGGEPSIYTFAQVPHNCGHYATSRTMLPRRKPAAFCGLSLPMGSLRNNNQISHLGPLNGQYR